MLKWESCHDIQVWFNNKSKPCGWLTVHVYPNLLTKIKFDSATSKSIGSPPSSCCRFC